jgi:hypothetical protein
MLARSLLPFLTEVNAFFHENRAKRDIPGTVLAP